MFVDLLEPNVVASLMTAGVEPMRIGIVAEDFPPNLGGMAVHAEHVARELAASDDVVVFTLPGHGLADSPFPQQPVLTRDLAQNAARLSNEGVDAWLFLSAGYAAIAAAFEQPVFVYFHGNDFLVPFPILRRRWLSSLNNMRYIWRYSGAARRLVGRRDIRRGLGNVEVVFTNSTNNARLIADIYSRKAIVAPPGVGDAFFVTGKPPATGPLRLLTVSRLNAANKRKNVDGVLRALTLLPESLAVRYDVVGDGNDRQRLEQIVRQLRLQDRVRFHGAVSQEELLEWYRKADLFVLASKADEYDVEGFGIVYIEASAAGIPAICSKEGGSTDAVQDDVNGIVIDNSSSQAIADGILRFVDSREKFPAEQVRAFAEQFRWPDVVQTIRREIQQRSEGSSKHAVHNNNLSTSRCNGPA